MADNAAKTPDNDDNHGRAGLSRDQARWLGPARLGIGLVWGLALWWLYRSAAGFDLDQSRSWPATSPQLFGPLLLVCAYVPVVALASVGRLRLRTGAIWLIVATVVLALLGLHDVARQAADSLRSPPYLTPPMLGFVAVALFIAHHLVAPADAERRWIASFPAYFDQAWKAGVQLALSLGFTGAFWLLLHLGAALFRIIGLPFLQELILHDWFALPISGLVFALAVHLTDVRDGLIRGVRTVGLMLLSWLLLVMTVLVAAFLIALPFTGLQGLWRTGSATALVLAAAAALIVLINTAYQDGRPDNLPPAVLRIAVRVAAVLITPLVLIAFWGLGLRIGQHGLTPDRIIALACALVGAAYAIGYDAAALIPLFRRGSAWMKALETTNIATAVLEVTVILALFSPLADPARLSVNDQMKRLQTGKVSAEAFDYRFLRFDSGKAGQTALATLTRSSDADIARRARAATDADDRYGLESPRPEEPLFTPLVEPWPAGRPLPADFVRPFRGLGMLRGCDSRGDCVATEVDLNGDRRTEILMATAYAVTLYTRSPQGGWGEEGSYPVLRCSGEPRADGRDLMRSGAIRPSPAEWPDLATGGRFVSRLNVSGPCRNDAPPVVAPPAR